MLEEDWDNASEDNDEDGSCTQDGSDGDEERMESKGSSSARVKHPSILEELEDL